MLGYDEAWQRLTAAQVKATGRGFIIGYVSENRTGKNITRAEVQAAHDAGLGVLLVYEYDPRAAEGGAPAGHVNGLTAIQGALAVGYPRGCAIAFAVDEQSLPLGALHDYATAFTGAVHTAGFRSMGYGGLVTITFLLNAGLVDLGWQTYAWSNGQWDSRAAIRQYRNGVTIDGVTLDLDQTMRPDFGAWMPTTTGDDMTPEEHAILTELQATTRALFWAWNPTKEGYLAAGGTEDNWNNVIGGIGGETSTNLVPRLFTALDSASTTGGLTADQVTTAVQKGVTEAMRALVVAILAGLQPAQSTTVQPRTD